MNYGNSACFSTSETKLKKILTKLKTCCLNYIS